MFRKIYHYLTGKGQLYHLIKEYRKTQFYSIEQINKYQLEHLNMLLSFVYNNNNYYRNLFDRVEVNQFSLATLAEFQKIPFLTKQLVKENFIEITSNGIPEKRKIKNSTSGSTGTNFHFLTDKSSLLHRHALNVRMDEWLGLYGNFSKFSIWGAPFETGKNRPLIQKLKDKRKNLRIVSGYQLTEKNMREYFEEMNDFKPLLVSGYPSTLYMFSEFLLKNNLSYIPKAIRTEGETLYQYQREIIEEAFKSHVYGYYSSREISGIGHECIAHDGFHIFAENVILEVIDDQGKVIDEGEGDVVLTDLHNYVMPLIRYRIGDRVVITREKCSCGNNLPLIKSVEGRTFDIVRFQNGNKVSGTFWTLLLRSKPGIIDFQVYQYKNYKIIIKIIIDNYFNKSFENFFKEIIFKYGGEHTQIYFEYVDEIPSSPGGKRRFVISEIQ